MALLGLLFKGLRKIADLKNFNKYDVICKMSYAILRSPFLQLEVFKTNKKMIDQYCHWMRLLGIDEEKLVCTGSVHQKLVAA